MFNVEIMYLKQLVTFDKKSQDIRNNKVITNKQNVKQFGLD
jgi:hypothetical protein